MSLSCKPNTSEPRLKVELDKVITEVSQQQVEVAENYAKWLPPRSSRPEADVGKYVATVERWESQLKRRNDVNEKEKIIDKQVLDETVKQVQSSKDGSGCRPGECHGCQGDHSGPPS